MPKMHLQRDVMLTHTYDVMIVWAFMQCCPINNSVHWWFGTLCNFNCLLKCTATFGKCSYKYVCCSSVYIHMYLLLTLPCIVSLSAQMSLSVLSVQKAKTGSATRTLTEPRSLQTVILMGHSFPPGSIIKGLYPISWQWNGVLAHQADCPVQTTNLEGCIVIVDNGVYHLRQRLVRMHAR